MAEIKYRDSENYPADAESIADEEDTLGDENTVLGDENDSALVFAKLLYGKPIQQIRNTTSKVATVSEATSQIATVVRRQDI